MTGATDVATAGLDERRRRIAARLQAEWRMIGSVSLRACRDAEGLAAEVRLDPVVLSGAFQQQGYPATPAAVAEVEARQQAAVEDCVRRVNAELPDGDRIRRVSIAG